MEIREGSRHTFCFRVEIITNLTILFVSLYFKVPQRYENRKRSVSGSQSTGCDKGLPHLKRSENCNLNLITVGKLNTEVNRYVPF